MWGSTCPDILPKYKLKRHYYNDSIDYIVFKIAKIIFFNRFLDLGGNVSSLKLFSRDIGIVSHYLSDFMCQAHAFEWSLPKTPIKHLKYENDLNEFAKTYNFDKEAIGIEMPEIKDTRILSTFPVIKEFISQVLDEYKSNQQGFVNDLDYAVSLNIKITEYIVESILATSPVEYPIQTSVYTPV